MTSTGMAWFDYTIDTEVVAGSVTCEVRSGAPPASIAGRTVCEPGDIGIVAPDMDWTASFHYRPGMVVGK